MFKSARTLFSNLKYINVRHASTGGGKGGGGKLFLTIGLVGGTAAGGWYLLDSGKRKFLNLNLCHLPFECIADRPLIFLCLVHPYLPESCRQVDYQKVNECRMRIL